MILFCNTFNILVVAESATTNIETCLRYINVVLLNYVSCQEVVAD